MLLQFPRAMAVKPAVALRAGNTCRTRGNICKSTRECLGSSRIMEYVRVITSHFLSKFPASSRDESHSPQPRPSSSSNPTAESQSPQARPPPHSPEPPSAVRQSQRINIPDEEPDLEKELRKSLMSLCFLAAIQITIQYRQVDESEIDDFIHLLSSAIAIIFACLFTSHFVGKIPSIKRKLHSSLQPQLFSPP
uniref:Uncharacterized protein n=1 Tax=Salix viminalis TaxID=40686 RepID=A0A6N2LIA7_SALVM